MGQTDSQKRRSHIDDAERAVNRAFSTGKADRASITRMAQLDAADAVAQAGVAMESDAAADEAERLAIIAAGMGNKEKAKAARERAKAARNQARDDHRDATKSAKKAYDAIRFSDPGKLGFMRVVQVLNLTHIVFTLAALIFTSRDTIQYSPFVLVNWLMVVLESVSFYFFFNRYKIGRPFGIAMSVVSITAHVLISIADGSFSVLNELFSNAFFIFLMFYFIFSDRVKSTLVNDLSQEKGISEQEEFVIEREGWPFVRNLIIYFVIFSILGHWMEAAYCQLIRMGIAPGEYDPTNTMLWRDWFYPYPMHGIAVVLMALVLYPLLMWLKKRFQNPLLPYVLSFLANTLTCTLIELVGGLLFNAELQNWDYTDMPFNFMGQVCLTNAIGFGVAASVISWFVYPALERLVARVRPATMNIVCIVVAIAGGILFSLYAISPPAGIDLAKTEHTAEDTQAIEHAGLKVVATTLSSNVGSAQEALDAATSLSDEERAALQERIDAVNADVEALNNELQK